MEEGSGFKLQIGYISGRNPGHRKWRPLSWRTLGLVVLAGTAAIMLVIAFRPSGPAGPAARPDPPAAAQPAASPEPVTNLTVTSGMEPVCILPTGTATRRQLTLVKVP
jgi:hypothetical protein